MFSFFKRNKWICDKSKSFAENEQKLRLESQENQLADNLYILAREFVTIEPLNAIRVMEESLLLKYDFSRAKWFGFRLYENNKLDKCYEVLCKIPENLFNSASERRIFKLISDDFLSRKKSETVNVPKQNQSGTKGKEINAKNNAVVKNIDAKNKIASNDSVEIKSRMSSFQERWIEQFDSILLNFKSSNGIKYYDKSELKIGIVCDEFFYESISASADYTYLTPNNFREHIYNIDLLLFVSTWRGLNNEWYGIGNKDSEKRKIAIKLIEECHNNNVPTIFYSKEDPTNYSVFVEFAEKCRFIFTSCIECISAYKKDCCNQNVFCMSFGINPIYHNPIGCSKEKKLNLVLFSGSWMGKYPKRCNELSTIFDGIVESKSQLKIVDRNYPKMKNVYPFPNKFFKYTVPSVKHEKLQILHKLSNYSVNINSVTESKTMFANRTYELQAIGNLLFSNYSLGMTWTHPGIFIINRKEDIARILSSMSDDFLYEKQIFGIRHVYSAETCFERINKLLNIVCNKSLNFNKKILVVVNNMTETAIHNFDRQSYENKTLVLSSELNSNLLSNFDMITWFSDKYLYEEFYLEDLINAFKYTSSKYVTKNSILSNEFVNVFESKYKTVFWINDFSVDFLLNLDEHPHLFADGYSSDNLSLLINHECKLENSNDYILSVIVLIDDNSDIFYGKLYTSLKLLPCYDKIEIFLSCRNDKNKLPSIISYLNRHNSNINVIQNSEKNISDPQIIKELLPLIHSDSVMVLYPESEIVESDLFNLIRDFNDSNCDVMLGNTYIFDDRNIYNKDHYSELVKYFNNGCIATCNLAQQAIFDKLELPNLSSLIFKKHSLEKIDIVNLFHNKYDYDEIFSFYMLNQEQKVFRTSKYISKAYLKPISLDLKDSLYTDFRLDSSLCWFKKNCNSPSYFKNYISRVIDRLLGTVDYDNLTKYEQQNFNNLLQIYVKYYEGKSYLDELIHDNRFDIAKKLHDDCNLLNPVYEEILSSDQLLKMISDPKKNKYFSIVNSKLSVKGNIDKHIILPINSLISDLGSKISICCKYRGTIDVRLLIEYVNDEEKQIGYQYVTDKESFVNIPFGTSKIACSLRIKGKGYSENISLEKKYYALNKADISSINLHDYASVTAFLKRFRVAIIADDFTWNSYLHEADMHLLNIDNIEKNLAEINPQLFFVESAWHGCNEQWNLKISHFSPELERALRWCKVRGIPTVFWNKEDPVHFDTFKDTAIHFDYIFTYDFDSVERYKELTNKNNAFYLPMGVQPILFNPIEKYERKDKFCFAGSYYAKYKERTKDLDDYIETLIDYRDIDIFDRQYGKNDPNYKFPDNYSKYICGNLTYTEIDKAYKGYKFAINLNSIKQAQSCARRVFELLACNTLVVSNFSIGVRTLFKDLVITSDSGKELVRRLKNLENDNLLVEKIKLLGLRKVFSESTYQDRLAYILSKCFNFDFNQYLKPKILVVSKVNSIKQFEKIKRMYDSQTYNNKNLFIIAPPNIEVTNDAVLIGSYSDLIKLEGFDYCAYFDERDYYGKNYLVDMILAFRYSKTECVSKGRIFRFVKNKIIQDNHKINYEYEEFADLRCSLFSFNAFSNVVIKDNALSKNRINIRTLSIDSYNYCYKLDVFSLNSNYLNIISDNEDNFDLGFSVQELQEKAEKNILSDVSDNESFYDSFDSDYIYEKIKSVEIDNIEIVKENDFFKFVSNISEEQKNYIFLNKKFTVREVTNDHTLRFYLKTHGDAKISLAYYFYDENNNKVLSKLTKSNTNIYADIPDNVKFIKFAFRLFSRGTVYVDKLILGNLVKEPSVLLNKYDTLLLSHNYPSYDDLYKYGFVHSRVRTYKKLGKRLVVFVLRDEGLQYSEFQDIDIIRGSNTALEKLISTGIKTIAVHFLQPAMWATLSRLPHNISIFIWSHGSDILLYKRREYNYSTPEQQETAKRHSELRKQFWYRILSSMPVNVHMIFVSQWLANIVMEDYEVELSEQHYSVIPNPIDTELFKYRPKQPEQRFKLLSIRPFSARVYANDITVEAIKLLSKLKSFNKFEILIVGDGELFEDAVAPLVNMGNVCLQKKFLTQFEIAEVHKDYGVFLCPSRFDSQGVSRDEARASGLVPITTNIAAIPEFVVNGKTAILTKPEDPQSLCDAVVYLSEHPDEFIEISKNASQDVYEKLNSVKIAKQELSLMNLFKVMEKEN